jgi:hypothetical protein
MRISKTRYNDAQMTDSNSLARAMLQNPAKLSPVMTYLGGRQDKKFPLTMLTEGMENTESIESDEYEYKVQTKTSMTRPVAETPNTTTGLGQGGQVFTLTFPDRWFIKDYVLISPSGVQARIMSQPTPNGKNWDYQLQLVNPNQNAVVPSQDVQAGSTWGMMFAPVGKDFSRGNASNWTTPSKVKHKLTKIRKSYEMSGDAKNWVMDVELPTQDGGTSNLWMDYEEWQYFLQWKEEQELLFWYGEKSYDNDGTTNLTDERGQPVIIGPGLFQQIINKDTYSELTADKLHNVIGDLFYGMTDAQNVQVTLFTGTGGKREFDNAMKNELANNNFTVLDQGKFVQGDGQELTLTGYFTSYRHVDGHLINVVKNPLFDHSAVADARRKHPDTGYSLESYRMVFVDQSTYEGEPNVKMINKQGEEMKRWAVPGSVVPRGFDQSTSRASDVDGASVHFMKRAGICLRRFDTSLDLQCVKQ